MSHRNARLTFMVAVCWSSCPRAGDAGRACRQGDGCLPQCAHRWVARFDAEGEAGLVRSVVAAASDADADRRRGRGGRCWQLGVEHRRGQDWLGPELGVPARTVSRILRRHDVPRLAVCDPMTGEVIRASKTTAVRYERDRPGELVHMDVKKIGRIPDGGGWRAHGREMGRTLGDARRPGSASTTSTPSSTTTAASRTPRSSPTRRPRHCARSSPERSTTSPPTASRIEAVMTDNHWSYTHSNALADAPRRGTASTTSLIKPHCPWQNGKVERFNRTLQTEWAYRQRLHHQRRTHRRPCTLARALQHSPPPQRPRRPPPDQPTVTNLMAGYT